MRNSALGSALQISPELRQLYSQLQKQSADSTKASTLISVDDCDTAGAPPAASVEASRRSSGHKPSLSSPACSVPCAVPAPSEPMQNSFDLSLPASSMPARLLEMPSARNRAKRCSFNVARGSIIGVGALGLVDSNAAPNTAPAVNLSFLDDAFMEQPRPPSQRRGGSRIGMPWQFTNANGLSPDQAQNAGYRRGSSLLVVQAGPRSRMNSMSIMGGLAAGTGAARRQSTLFGGGNGGGGAISPVLVDAAAAAAAARRQSMFSPPIRPNAPAAQALSSGSAG